MVSVLLKTNRIKINRNFTRVDFANKSLFNCFGEAHDDSFYKDLGKHLDAEFYIAAITAPADFFRPIIHRGYIYSFTIFAGKHEGRKVLRELILNFSELFFTYLRTIIHSSHLMIAIFFLRSG